MGTDTRERPLTSEAIAGILISAADDHRSGRLGEPGECARTLLACVGDRSAALDRAAGELGRSGVRTLAAAGWLPGDLAEIAGRRLTADAAEYVVDAIADECQRYAAPTIDPRWHEQLSRLDARVWWSPDGLRLAEWARRHGRSLTDTVAMVITVTALFRSLPSLPVIVPPPGRATGGVDRPDVDQRVLGKVRALLAKAESTDFPEEAEALSAKAQQLMSRHTLSRAVLDAGRAGSAGVTASTATDRFWLENPYLTAKAMLVDAVATANRTRTVFHGRLGFLAIMGDPVDVNIVSVLATSLLVQATRAMLAAGSQVSGSGRSRTKSFRQAFLVSYAGRIGERLTEADRATATEMAPAADLLPVLAGRVRAAEELMATLYPTITSQTVRVSNSAGWNAGRAAADLAHLHPERPMVS